MPSLVSLAGLAAACGFWLLSGCNVFSPLAEDADKDLTYRGLILKGNAAINKGRYAEAEAFFARAKTMNPEGSEAFLYHSKALMSLYGIDYKSLNDEFESRRNKDGKGKKGIPFLDSTTTRGGIDSVYYPVAQSVENLEHILRHARDTVRISGKWSMLPDGDTAGDGRISEGVARLDLGILQTIKGMLGPLDLDGDNHVGAECGRNLCPGLDAACMEGAAYKSKCKEGLPSEINGLEDFKNLTRSLDINDPNSEDLRPRQVSSNPNDINDFLDRMLGPIAASSFNLDSVNGALANHKEDKLGDQLGEISTNITDLSNFLSFMRYNDRVDNDFDSQDGSGGGSPMVWHDYNKDGGIRYDYDDGPVMEGYVGTPANAQSENIGHPLHRMLFPDLYVRFSDSSWLKRSVSGDTSKNARKAAMVKHCQTVARTLEVDGKVTGALIEEIVANTCTTFTAFLKPSVKPPARSDWVSGTFGIDEEMIDERDNDYDGLKDEDARNAPGMDDDDDGLLNTTMVGTAPAPMAWKDLPGHGNQCPDIDAEKEMLPPPFSRQFCIGSLEHRIYLAEHGGRDTLKVYYSRFPGEGANRNCLEDFDKLPAAYKEATGLKTNSDAVQDACLYKHIWIHGMPPASEWTSGVLGVDEELPDGVDNDGDGWIDEDAK